ncbi:methyl-accepting chemotaxis protein [Tepidibacillus marianensis]|uniref:methyl-accepting chemotaxis protein n=1 Tax=Tepidibacillus marianensis TaxID=3131995 RepID=UPI0030CFA28A
MTVGRKLAIGFLSIMVMFFIAVFFIYYQIHILGNSVQSLVSQGRNYNQILTIVSTKVGLIKSLIWIIIPLGIVGAGTIAYIITVNLSRPVRKVTEYVSEVAKGNLKIGQVHIKNKDEIGDLASQFNIMLNALRELIQTIQESSLNVTMTAEQLSSSSDEVARAAEQVTETTNGVADGTYKQVHLLQENEGILTGVIQSINDVNDKTKSIEIVSHQSMETAEQGDYVIKETIEQMAKMNHTVQETGQYVDLLGQKSGQIEKVIEIIQSVSEQTNLLALNAAIEASRAGEAGRGFAVVATEIRKLAEQSSKAGEDIVQMVRGLQQETAQVIDSMKKGEKEVEHGINYVAQAQQAFKAIYDSNLEMSNLITETRNKSEDMVKGMEKMSYSSDMVKHVADETSTFAQQIAAATEEQGASMEEITASANTLNEMATDLQQLIKKFDV